MNRWLHNLGEVIRLGESSSYINLKILQKLKIKNNTILALFEKVYDKIVLCVPSGNGIAFKSLQLSKFPTNHMYICWSKAICNMFLVYG